MQKRWQSTLNYALRLTPHRTDPRLLGEVRLMAILEPEVGDLIPSLSEVSKSNTALSPEESDGQSLAQKSGAAFSSFQHRRHTWCHQTYCV